MKTKAKVIISLLVILTFFLIGSCSKPTNPDLVSTPFFNPPGGTFESSQTVGIECETSGVSIYYTLDGTEPNSASPIYTKPITIDETTTIKAKAFRSGMQDSKTASATYTINLPPVPENFVLVEGGTVAGITVDDFFIDKYELTQAEYETVMGANPSWFDGNPNHPVEQVSWFDAIEYCNRRSIKEGLAPCYSYSSYGTNPANWPAGWNESYQNHVNVSCDWNAIGYRLPTEAEWEYAARGGLQTHGYTYSGSNNVDEVAWYYVNSDDTTHEVGGKLPNELGIYDMSGNVWEWCWDLDIGSYRVRRGGSWIYDAYSCRVSSRNYDNATHSLYYLGFRVCRVSP